MFSNARFKISIFNKYIKYIVNWIRNYIQHYFIVVVSVVEDVVTVVGVNSNISKKIKIVFTNVTFFTLLPFNEISVKRFFDRIPEILITIEENILITSN